MTKIEYAADDIIDDYSNWKVAKKMLTTKLVNKSRNSSSVYRSAKGYGFPDLVIVPIMEVNISGIKGSVTINDDHIESWGISKRTVIDTAIKNTECEIKKTGRSALRSEGYVDGRNGNDGVMYSDSVLLHIQLNRMSWRFRYYQGKGTTNGIVSGRLLCTSIVNQRSSCCAKGRRTRARHKRFDQ